jgi:hypothetical protein
MSYQEKRSHQHIWVGGKKLTVLSAKISFPQGRLTVRTDVFGQFNFLQRSEDYEIMLSSGEQYRGRYVTFIKDPRLETCEFQLLPPVERNETRLTNDPGT